MKSVDTEELFSRGVASFIDPDNSFRKKIEAKIAGQDVGDIIIKFGVDPTKPDLHLGHAVVLRKLRSFQDIGCKIVFLVGDITAQIGDPTGKDSIRPEINLEEVQKNSETYISQLKGILKQDAESLVVVKNSDWFVGINDIIAPEGRTELDLGNGLKIKSPQPLASSHILNKASFWVETRMQKGLIINYTLLNILSVLRKITHSQLIERDMFQKRMNEEKELYMHEMLYPVLQGIDSNVICRIFGSCDLEIGGSDQTFNMLMGRSVLKMNNHPEQAVMSLDILEGIDGKQKMSKSLDNYVGITDEPNDMYGKILSIPDVLIPKYFRLATYTPLAEVSEIEKSLASPNVNPRDIKMRLAREITAIYHGDEASQKAETHFIETFSEKKIPENVPEIEGEFATIIDAMMQAECADSKSEARRLVEAGAVTHLENDTKVSDSNQKPERGTYRVGKLRFFRIK